MSDPRVTLEPSSAGLHVRRTRPVCDFCGRELGRRWARWACPAFGSTMPTDDRPVRLEYGGHWAACSGCAPLVRSRSWGELIDRVMQRWASVNGDRGDAVSGVQRRELAALYLRLEGLLGEESEGRDRSSKRRGCRR